MHITSPPELRGEPYQCVTEDLTMLGMPSRYTTLFRGSTGIGEVLGMAAEQPRPDGQPLRVVSAGCSYGAEVDTVLALAYRHLSADTIAITGIDSNEEALQAAQAARYRIGAFIGAAWANYKAHGYDFSTTMQEHGIDMRVREANVRGPVLCTEQLRSVQRVAWRLGNLATDVLGEQPAHLILCNNVIYHFRQDVKTANAIAANLGENLAVGGILSFGANLVHAAMGEWAHSQAAPLLAEQGLVTIASSNQDLVAFQRIRG